MISKTENNYLHSTQNPQECYHLLNYSLLLGTNDTHTKKNWVKDLFSKDYTLGIKSSGQSGFLVLGL